MVLAAYLAGVLTPVAAVLGGYAGAWWWRRYRRMQADASIADQVLELTEVYLPTLPPQDPNDAPQLNRMRYRNAPGRRRAVRGHRPK